MSADSCLPIVRRARVTCTCNQEMRLTNLLVGSTWMTAGALHANLVFAQGTALAITIPAATAATSTTQQTPSDTFQSAAQRTLNEIQFNRDAYRKDPSKLRPLVDKYLLPLFDTEYAARLLHAVPNKALGNGHILPPLPLLSPVRVTRQAARRSALLLRIFENPAPATNNTFVRSQDFGDTLADSFFAKSRSKGVCPSRAPWGRW
jgi:hypothetical protein